MLRSNVREGVKGTVIEALRKALFNNEASTQEGLRKILGELGFRVNQSTVSRALKKLGAVKNLNERGESTYQLPRRASPAPTSDAALSDLVTSIVHNQSLIIMKTTPGSASLIALHLDHFKPGGILGTLAGDDTIFVAPPARVAIARVIEQIEASILG